MNEDDLEPNDYETDVEYLTDEYDPDEAGIDYKKIRKSRKITKSKKSKKSKKSRK